MLTTAEPPVAGDRARLGWVEMLRGLAVLAVLLEHFMLAAIAPVPRHFLYYFNAGVFGVVVFFFISGFIIPYSVVSLHRAPAAQAALRFAIGRFFRLYPVYWLSLLAAMALLPFPGWGTLAANVSMLQRFFGSHDMLGVYWTLQVELIFYAVVLVLLMRGKVLAVRLYPILTFIFAGLSIGMGALRQVYQWHTPLAAVAGVTVMFSSTTLFMHLRYSLMKRGQMVLFGVATYLLLCVSFGLGYARDYGYRENPSEFYLTYLAAALVFLAFLKYTPSIAPLNFLGRISYPVYLLHTLVAGTVGLAIWRRFGVGWSLTADFILVLVLCSAVHYLLENPSIRWGKAVVRRLGPADDGVARKPQLS